MEYEVNYDDGEKEGCSSKLEIAHRIFYVKLLKVPPDSAVYYAGDAHGLLKEISKGEFDFWLKVLAGNEREIETIKKKLSVGKKYTI